jgi:hypothetical protein
MLKARVVRTRFLRAFSTSLFLILSCAEITPTQEIEGSVTIDQRTATAFCKDLREAVRAQEHRKISSWILNFPIEVQRGGKNILVVDNADFVRKFQLIFDGAMKSSLFGPSGCESKSHPGGDAGLADDQIIITQLESDSGPHISGISPPADADPSRYLSNDQYEKGAQEFFKKLQQAILADNRSAVASMCVYPISVCIKGKPVTIQNHVELIRNYPQIFDRGEGWLDVVVWTHVYRVRSVCGRP